MVGHATYPALDPTPELPAVFSRRIVVGLLRARIGFDGLVATDDLEMGAVAPLDPDGEAAVRAIDAGCDLALYCADLARAERAHARLVRRAMRDSAFARRLRNAATNVERAAESWPAPTPDLAVFASARGGLHSG
jgi:beta-N-acetylhexosaminidase